MRYQNRDGTWNTNKKHSCPYCTETFAKNRLGAHIFKAHKDVVVAKLKPYSTIVTPTVPLSIGGAGLYFCGSCHDVWEHEGRAIAHKDSHDDCSWDRQLTALYTYMGCAVPVVNGTVVERTIASHDSAELRETKKLLDLSVNDTIKLQSTIYKLRSGATVTAPEPIQAESEAMRVLKRKCRMLEAQVALIEYQRTVDADVLKEKLNVAQLFIDEYMVNAETAVLARNAIEDVAVSDDETLKLMSLEDEVKYWRNPPQAQPVEVVAKPKGPSKEEVDAKLKALKAKPKPVTKPTPVLQQKAAPCKDHRINTAYIENEPCDHCGDHVETYLRHCEACNKKTCVENDLTGCYQYKCTRCAKHICLGCTKRNGTKLKPWCSAQCRAAAASN
jgi:hypothetical protein